MQTTKLTLIALINGYLFTSLFKACIESLASEMEVVGCDSKSRKNISDLLDAGNS